MGAAVDVWWEQFMEGLSRHLHKESSIKLHSKLKPLFGEKSRENFGESAKERVRGCFCLALYCHAP